MSIARAFAPRRQDKDSTFSSLHGGHAASQRHGRPVKRSQISAPVALISTTNPLSYDAPDIPGTKPIHVRTVTTISTTSTSTGEESEAPSLSFDGTDASSFDESPTTPEPGPNHLSCYFKPAVDTTTHHQSPAIATPAAFDAPRIPQRVPSHSKRAHEIVHRKRSVQRMMSPPASLARRNSSDFFGSWSHLPDSPKQENPFVDELAQLDAVVEEMSHVVRDAEAEEDRHCMEASGLARLDVNDYMAAINGLVDEFLVDVPVWI